MMLEFPYLLWIPIAYIFFAGLTNELIEGDRDDKFVGSIFWPVVWACWVVYRIAILGPSIVRAIRAWRQARKIPAARIHREDR